MKTYKLLTGIALALAPGAALATTSDDECAAACESPETAASCCLAETVAVSEAPAALASLTVPCERGMIGVYLADTDDAAVVEGLVEGGPAAQAGIQAGDRILAVGDKKVKSWDQLSEWMQSRQAGERLGVTIERDGWKKVVEVTLAPAPEPPAGAGSNAAEAPSMGYFFDVEEGPMTLELLGEHHEEEHGHDHDGAHDHDGGHDAHPGHDDDHEHGDQPHVMFLNRGGGQAMVLGQDGGQWVTTLKQGDGHEIHEIHGLHGSSIGDPKGNVMIKVMRDGEVVDLQDIEVDFTDGTHGTQDFYFDDGQVEGHANVIIKAMKDGRLVELEDLDIDLSDLHMDLSQLHEGLDLEELHESLGQLHGLHVNVTKEIECCEEIEECDEDGCCEEECCEDGDECCEGEAQANVFHVLGGQQKGAAKGVVVQRLGGTAEAPHQLRWVTGGDLEVHGSGDDEHETFKGRVVEGHPNVVFGIAGEDGHGLHFLGESGAEGEGGDLRQQILIERRGHVEAPEVLRGRLLARPDVAPEQRVRLRRQLAAPGNPGRAGNADLDALRGELQALRDELRQLRQSLRRIQAGQRR